MKDITWKWIGTFSFLVGWILIMIYPEQVNIRYIATIYTIVLIIFRWIDSPKSNFVLQSNKVREPNSN